MYRTKEDILVDCPELELTEFGDFAIRKDCIKDYEIIDFHCHLFSSLKELFPKFLCKEIHDMKSSFFDKSCFNFSLELFDIQKTCFTGFPERIISVDGIRTRWKLLTGEFIVRRASTERLLRDMKMNHISSALVLQINPPDRNTAQVMEDITTKNRELMTFGSIHPNDGSIKEKIEKYLSLNIKGWKLNPHICGFNIDDRQSIDLIRVLAETKLPILSCSGLGIPKKHLNSNIVPRKLKEETLSQCINKFYKVFEAVPDATFILAHGGIFELDELVMLMQEFPNTYTDISTQPSGSIRKLIDKVGSERILFGTDYPFFNHAFSIMSVLRATSQEEERRNIFSRNARRLLRI